ncbi:Protein of unknown function [Cognatiyoonia koreensis]|uniref:VWFA domain-containing protein n=1 Tax=Cognatiyoonia koreensis TaxID=364200 RepID=A0A1I0Q894_9RHOB|nr:DUF1194 domain-containing protein [Cognatiyoonia koreensis]SEW23227.1 Protein of unknown function [Cognatiyoonia koreensis]
MVKRFALCLTLLLIPQAALACRLALVLAIDVSSSVDATEDALQRGGLARALLDPDVQDAFFVSPEPVALMVFEWSGRYNQVNLLDWTMIENQADLLRASGRIGRSIRSHNDFPTALGYALGYAATALDGGPDCQFSTIDMSGDGINNDGFGPAEAYAAFPFDGVTVNGLVVNAAEFTSEVDLIEFYETEVIRGPGAFVEIAQGFEDYARAIRRKLIRELSAQVIGAIDAGVADPG